MPEAPDPSRRDPDGSFVILFPGRTGSSWLVSALEGHPRIDVRGEILVGLDAARQRRLIEERLGTGSPTTRVRGFKTKLKDVADLDGLRATIGDRVRVVHMQRRDLLRLAISTVNARRLHRSTGRWNRSDGVRELPPLEIDVGVMIETIDACAAAVERLGTFVASLAAPVLEVDYAEVLESPSELLQRVQRHVGVEPRSLRSAVLKNTGTDLHTAIANFDRFAGELSRTRWGDLISDLDPAGERLPRG